MKERPILFSGEMVSAILEGRKTQTRRVIKVPRSMENFYRFYLGGKWMIQPHPGGGWWANNSDMSTPLMDKGFDCPYGKPGDRLWVRETWRLADRLVDGYERDAPYWLQFKAGGHIFHIEGEEGKEKIAEAKYQGVGDSGWSVDSKFGKWKPSIHMPRWASRITLEIADVRVERVRDISEEDAIAEGMTGRDEYSGRTNESEIMATLTPRDEFEKLWDSINAKRGFSWDSNPWVWVIRFEVLK